MSAGDSFEFIASSVEDDRGKGGSKTQAVALKAGATRQFEHASSARFRAAAQEQGGARPSSLCLVAETAPQELYRNVPEPRTRIPLPCEQPRLQKLGPAVPIPPAFIGRLFHACVCTAARARERERGRQTVGQAKAHQSCYFCLHSSQSTLQGIVNAGPLQAVAETSLENGWRDLDIDMVVLGKEVSNKHAGTNQSTRKEFECRQRKMTNKLPGSRRSSRKQLHWF